MEDDVQSLSHSKRRRKYYNAFAPKYKPFAALFPERKGCGQRTGIRGLQKSAAQPRRPCLPVL